MILEIRWSVYLIRKTEDLAHIEWHPHIQECNCTKNMGRWQINTGTLGEAYEAL